MKNYFKYGLLLLMLSSFVSLNEIVSAIKSGNASELSKHFDNTIEITLTDKKNTYSKSQAELVIKDFFKTNVVTGFEILHKDDKTNTQFIIGNLETKNGDYRTTIYMKQKGNKQLLQELRFER
ncbi:MAG TPA: DUF4783 domain-containing protein [Chitinophagaceae bacterium]|nr:DUF4783 domain-containing protein [Chitinophagaceae bacterium]